jgi:hypothetical protein
MSRAVTIHVAARRAGVLSETVVLVLPGEELALPVSARVLPKGDGGEAVAIGVRHEAAP